ncbi:MAG: phytanoyl-CoA dioxygenase family protein [Bacteroidota bacterium]|jgi:hypothetical protein
MKKLLYKLDKHRRKWMHEYIVAPKLNRAFGQNKPELDPIQQRILKDLNETGIAFLSFNDLFPDVLLQKLEQEYNHFENQQDVKNIITQYKSGVEQDNPNYKQYNIRHSQHSKGYHASDAIMQIALHSKLTDLVSTYFNEQALLRYVDFWYSIASGNQNHSREYSQNWHRDPEDLRMLKVFIYLNDVTERNGAFEYIKCSTRNNQFGNVFPYDNEHPENYPEESELRKQIPDSYFVNGSGKKGTIILCDTHGFHRGGFCVDGDRKLMTFMYLRASLFMSNQFKLKDKEQLNSEQKIVIV